MRANGNGSPRVCAENLLMCSIGEIPFERVKGLDPTIIHTPSGEARQRLLQDADWLVSTYEPRVIVRAINITQEDGIDGSYSVSVDIALKEE